MKTLISTLTLTDLFLTLGIGVATGIVYYVLLWYSLKLLPKVKQRGLFLFASAAFRIFILILTALYFSHDHAGRFLLIIIGFILTRVVCLNVVKHHLHKNSVGAKK